MLLARTKQHTEARKNTSGSLFAPRSSLSHVARFLGANRGGGKRTHQGTQLNSIDTRTASYSWTSLSGVVVAQTICRMMIGFRPNDARSCQLRRAAVSVLLSSLFSPFSHRAKHSAAQHKAVNWKRRNINATLRHCRPECAQRNASEP